MKKLITILGPTASGKTTVATRLAAEIGGEILSADSRQVYRRMDIGTGKDLSDYQLQDGRTIPYHLIDIAEPGTKYNLFLYQQDFWNAYDDIVGRGAWPILCGGTGLYIESVLKGYQLPSVPQNQELRDSLKDYSLEELTQMLVKLKKQNGTVMHNTTDVDSCQRAIRAIEIETAISEGYRNEAKGSGETLQSIIIGIDIDRELRRKRITERLHKRLEEGMVDEVRHLLDEGIPPENLMYYGLEYKFLTMYIIGEITYSEMVSQLEIAIHQFAKRQMTWFRGMERRGLKINWLERPENNQQLGVLIEEIRALVRKSE
ncbi:MAG: tRNA (adenosine(37)-N6)-dimethylallyltransferase MiaA [Prevotella sp.]|nr:tRNA (adenosine(37)-N6)-dimethylallyltransferase MiaA [Prevotella sp.]